MTTVATTKKGEAKRWMQEHVTFAADECLVFPFSRSPRGYGGIQFGGFSRAHRWMCNAAHGPAPDGKPFALHSCGNGSGGCVNPRHLYWGNGRDNYADQVTHGVVAVGERHGKAKLSEKVVRDIRLLARAGKTYAEIAELVGAQRDAVRSVVRGRCWRWLA